MVNTLNMSHTGNILICQNWLSRQQQTLIANKHMITPEVNQEWKLVCILTHTGINDFM